MCETSRQVLTRGDDLLELLANRVRVGEGGVIC